MQNAVARQAYKPGLWKDLVELEAATGRDEHARADVQRALKRHPRNAELLKLAALVRLKRRRPRGHSPTSSTAGADARSADLAAAREKLDALVKAHPMTRGLRFVEVEVAAASARAADVPPLYGAALELHKQYPEAWETRMLLASLLLRRSPVQNMKQAVQYAEQAWQMTVDNAWAGLALIRAYVASGKSAYARAIATKLVAVRPEVAAHVEEWLGSAR